MKTRKTTLIILVCFILLIIFIVSYMFTALINNFSSVSTNDSAIKTIIVDAGHGGEDGGAIGIDGTVEKNINLDIALKLEKILKLYGYNVIMTRTQDAMTCDENLKSIRQKKVSDIHNRFKIIEENPNALFVSIHQNKFESTSQWGTQVFYSKNNEKSKLLADNIQTSITENIQMKNKRVTKKTGTEIFLLYHSTIPSVLVECGFLSNYDDLNKLKTDIYRKEMAILIADGILKYNSVGD